MNIQSGQNKVPHLFDVHKEEVNAALSRNMRALQNFDFKPTSVNKETDRGSQQGLLYVAWLQHMQGSSDIEVKINVVSIYINLTVSKSMDIIFSIVKYHFIFRVPKFQIHVVIPLFWNKAVIITQCKIIQYNDKYHFTFHYHILYTIAEYSFIDMD